MELDKYIILYNKLSNNNINYLTKFDHISIGKNNIVIEKPTDKEIYYKIINYLIRKRILFYCFDYIDNLLNFMLEKNITISVVESVTGGKLSDTIVNQEGISKIFKGSIIAYSTSSKIELLNISRKAINKYGTVSFNISNKMIDGLKNYFSSDVYISATGYAGPTCKDVGTIYVTIAYNGKKYNFKWNFRGKRNDIRKGLISYIFWALNKILIKEY
jgi:PncC family amidohydrolase